MLQLQEVKELVAQADEPVLTLYINSDPALPENQAAHPAWRIWVKNALRDLEQQVTDETSAQWKDIRARAESELESLPPAGKGLMLLAAPSFIRVYPLPVSIEPRASFGAPLIAPLLWMLDEYEPYVVVLVDHEKARFIIAYLGGVDYEETATFELDTSNWPHKSFQTASLAADRAVQGSARDDYEKRIKVHEDRFRAEVAERATLLADQYHARRFILGGNEQAAHAIKRLMSPSEAGRVVAILPVPMRVTPAEVLRAALPVALEYERHAELGLVEDIIGLAKAGGRGAVGQEAVRRALERRQVELLVLPWPLADDGLAVELPLQVFASGGQIETVHGAAAERLKAEGGLAARLYYAL